MAQNTQLHELASAYVIDTASCTHSHRRHRIISLISWEGPLPFDDGPACSISFGETVAACLWVIVYVLLMLFGYIYKMPWMLDSYKPHARSLKFWASLNEPLPTSAKDVSRTRLEQLEQEHPAAGFQCVVCQRPNRSHEYVSHGHAGPDMVRITVCFCHCYC